LILPAPEYPARTARRPETPVAMNRIYFFPSERHFRAALYASSKLCLSGEVLQSGRV
jgi:hypothetical protein